VKGTQTSGNSVFLTRNEVDFARAHKDLMVLFVVHSVEVHHSGAGLVAAGGIERVVAPWDPDVGVLSSITFSYTMP